MWAAAIREIATFPERLGVESLDNERISANFGTRMETVFVKILAAALAFSQVAVNPGAVKTEFSRDRDQRQVTQLLQAAASICLMSLRSRISTSMTSLRPP